MKRSLKKNRLRLGIIRILFAIIFVLVAGRAFQLQVVQGDKLRRLGERQHLKEWIVLPKRGAVLDRAGEALAISLEAQSVFARPHRVHDVEGLSRNLARILKLKPADVKLKLNSDKPFVWIKRQVAPREAEQIQSLGVDGVGMFYEPHRYYPQGQLAGQVIGFVGRDSEGLEGLELYYNDYIRGQPGSPVTERDALGRRVLVQGLEGLQIPPGADVHLTLDKSIQHLAEKELDSTVNKYRAKAAVAIVIEPRTGEILALANYPAFNPNNFSKESNQHKRNRAIADSFEPGSTFKTILAAAALEEGVVGKEDLFYCEMGKYLYAGKVLHDTHPHGWLPFSKILQVSSNIGFTKVAEKLKKDRFFKYIEKFGFGQPTGIDMPGEVPGLVRPPQSWSGIDLATHAFGQGISTTPLQLATAYAAVANGGILMRPYVVRKVVGANGEVLLENQPHVVRRVISETTSRLLSSMLKEVTTEGGTGTNASVEGFDVAGKTGTAQKPDPTRRGYAGGKRVASFIGFVPADDPKLVLAVVVDEPQVNVYGGIVAAPAFRNIARGALRQLAVAPQNPDLVPMGSFRAVSKVEPSTVSKVEPSMVSKVEPSLAVFSRLPVQRENRNPGTTGSDGPPAVPDFVGLSLREAVEKARELKLKLEMHGTGYVVKQQPAPGHRWSDDDVVVLKLQG